MSFSHEIKLELLKKQMNNCCKDEFYCSFFRFSKNINVEEKFIEINVNFDFKDVMMSFIQWAKLKFDVSPHSMVYVNSNSCLVTYRIERNSKAKRFLNFVDFYPMDDDIVFEEHWAELKNCCARMYVAGAFFMCGSVADPNVQYHLEIKHADAMLIEELDECLRSIGINGNVAERKGKYIYYLKGSEGISDFLKYIGLNHAVLQYEDIRIIKETRNKINREVNCETANMQKTINAAQRQIQCIELLQQSGELALLSKGLREAAEVRMDNPEASIEELSQMMSKKISKSGMNHRLRKLVDIAENKGF